ILDGPPDESHQVSLVAFFLRPVSSQPGRPRLYPAGAGAATMARCIGLAKVAELVDALDLGSSAARRGGSSPPFRTMVEPSRRRFRPDARRPEGPALAVPPDIGQTKG